MKKHNLKEIYKAIIMTFIIMTIVIGGVIISLSILKDEAVQTNLKIADFHANTLSEQIIQTFINLDLIIKDLDSSIITQIDMESLESKFTNIMSNNPYIRSINLLDSKKVIVYSSNEKNIGVKIANENFYPKPMFKEAILQFGNPYIGRDFEDSQDASLLKDIDKNNSSFLPLMKKISIDMKDYYISININSDYFINKYATNLENNFATLELIRIDGILLFSSNSNNQVGIQVEETALIKEAIEKNKSLGIETINGKKYLSSNKLTDIFPLNIVVRLDFEKTMTKWEQKRVIIIFIITLLVLFSIALVFTLIYRYSKEKQNELDLQKSTEKTLKKAKELAEKANKAKSDFLANISHEIRTPLNGTIGLTDLVLNTSLDEVQKDYLEKAQKSSYALLHLINDILDYSKIEAGKLSLENRVFELDDVSNNIKDLFEYQAISRDISLEIYTPKDLILIGDSLRLRQILTNIVGNAIKFTKEGFIKYSVSVKEEDNESMLLHFSIKDSGIGMSKEVQQNLFKEFTQADTSVTRKYGGTGLGLAISKQLVMLMDGRIWLESSLGVGSEFMFDIKFKKANLLDKEKIIKKPTQTLEIKKLQASYILLVEDNSINQIVAVGILESLGLSVDIASNGKEAVDKVKTQEYDLILMDIQMPIMDGFEASRKIREFNKEIPIIALSAAVMQEDKEKTKSAGMNAHLEKPINQEKLYETLSLYLKEKDIKEKPSILKAKEQEKLKEEDLLDDYYGVDIEELKDRIGDNKELIKRLLLNFCNEYSNPEDKFNIDNIESESFSKAIHSLKGVSGNISLKSIFELSKKIHDCDEITKKAELTPQLIELLKETTKNLAIKLKNNSFDKELDIEYNQAEIKLFLKDFVNDLEHFVVVVPKRINILLQILKKHIESEEITNIKDDLNHYRYKEASNKIKEIYEIYNDKTKNIISR